MSFLFDSTKVAEMVAYLRAHPRARFDVIARRFSKRWKTPVVGYEVKDVAQMRLAQEACPALRPKKGWQP